MAFELDLQTASSRKTTSPGRSRPLALHGSQQYWQRRRSWAPTTTPYSIGVEAYFLGSGTGGKFRGT
jgi:hypothetical protein